MHGQKNIKSVNDLVVKQLTYPPTLLRVIMQIRGLEF